MSPDSAAATKLGRKTVLGSQLESQLIDYILMRESKFHGLMKTDLRRMAYMLAKRNNLQNPYSESVRRPTGSSFARAFGFDKEKVDALFNLLEDVYNKNNHPPNRIYNVDESGLTIVQNYEQEKSFTCRESGGDYYLPKANYTEIRYSGTSCKSPQPWWKTHRNIRREAAEG
ncbi:hypothetical protein NQ318_022691 [Aromia moschata]|uniref:Transposase n=1 Tax=Aromia moschata TaxID=1265417 RepID=A0AAV8YDG3_9CUCU|nr:hypothetical protein NQ318_022691 [Aromia moschata]